MPQDKNGKDIILGDMVYKSGGDYYFSGTIQSIFQKRNGQFRVVVENHDGVLHIFNITQVYRAS